MQETIRKYLIDFCQQNSITLYLQDSDFVSVNGLPCSGYFQQTNVGSNLVVAANGKFSDVVGLHESCHARQCLEGAQVWKDILGDGNHNGCLDLLDLWVGGNIELEPEKLTQVINQSIAVELDCEKRTVELAKELKFDLDEKHYIKQANSYLRFYQWVKLRRRWSNPGVSPYSNEDLVKAMSDNFDMDYFAPLSDKEVELFDFQISA